MLEERTGRKLEELAQELKHSFKPA